MKPEIRIQLDPSECRWFARVLSDGEQVYVTGEYLLKVDAESAAKRWIKKTEDRDEKTAHAAASPDRRRLRPS